MSVSSFWPPAAGSEFQHKPGTFLPVSNQPDRILKTKPQEASTKMTELVEVVEELNWRENAPLLQVTGLGWYNYPVTCFGAANKSADPEVESSSTLQSVSSRRGGYEGGKGIKGNLRKSKAKETS